MDDAPAVSNSFSASLVWLHAGPFVPGKTYLLKHTAQTVKAHLRVAHRLDIETLEPQQSAVLRLNEIGEVEVRTSRSLMLDPYRENRVTGSFILIDPASNATVGAGMVHYTKLDKDGRSQINGTLLLLPGEVLVSVLEEKLTTRGKDVVITSSQKPEVWQSLLYAGFTVLVPSKSQAQAEIITLAPDAHELLRRPVARHDGLKAQADALLRELENEF